MEEYSNKMSLSEINGYISSIGTFADPYAWIDGIEEEDEELLDDEVRKIFSLTDVDFETARKRNSVDFFLLENELENITHNSKECSTKKGTSLKQVREAGGISPNGEKHDRNNNSGDRKTCNGTNEVCKDYFLMNQTENVSSPVDTAETKPNLNGACNNSTASGDIPVIVTHWVGSPESDMVKLNQEANQGLKVKMGSPSTSRCSTPITLRARSLSFKEIKDCFEAKIHAAEVIEKSPLTPRKMRVKKPETTEQLLTNQVVDYRVESYLTPPSPKLKEPIQSSDEVESETTLELPQIILNKFWVRQDSDEENDDTVTVEDEDSTTSTLTSDSDDKEESDQEEADVPLCDYVERLIKAEHSDTSSDESCSSDVIFKRIASKVLKKVKMKYAIVSESSSSSNENSEDEDSEHKVERKVVCMFKKNVIRNAREKVRVERDSDVQSSKEDAETFDDEVSVVSDSFSTDDSETASDSASDEDSSEYHSNPESENVKSHSERSDIYGLQDDQDALSETDESVIYQSYNLEEQSGRAIVYHEETPNSLYAKSSSGKMPARSRSLPDHFDKDSVRKQVSFDEDPEFIPSPELPRKGIPVTLEEHLVSDLRWPFTNFYVKEVQEDMDDSHHTENHQYSGALPCYKSKMSSSSFPGRKKDVMLGRVWWVEWWAGDEHNEKEAPALTSVQSTESL